ncbi:MAG TPA: GAF domain-containing protein, partial [Blastocatellia bacterium]|nr:GAF domain-containing protein [Blastocatellia bacterium]
MLGVPLLREGLPIGVLTLTRSTTRPFTEKQIELATIFADQAVIAIENVRLFDEVEARTRDLSESLEQQTATSEVLKVISSSPSALEPVFNAMLENATRICEATFGNLFLRDGPIFRAVALQSQKSHVDILRRNPVIDPREYPGIPLDRALKTKQVVHIPDLRTDQSYMEKNELIIPLVEVVGVRTYVLVPMLKENELVGAIGMYRQEVRPFSDKQIELVKNFAAQAVIAIENARLLSELRESLQQQTATADVLKVISRSTFDLQTVLETLTESAARLCAANNGAIQMRDGDVFRFAAGYGFSREAEQYGLEHPLRLDRGSLTGRVALESRAIHLPDVLADPEYQVTGYQKTFGYRTILGVPLLREGTTIGVFALTRNEVNSFTDKQIELVTTFADQAAIAIENVRLFNSVEARTRELSESLKQQTATSDVLKVISSSTGELQPVFDTMLENATRLCAAKFGNLYLCEGDAFRNSAMHNVPPAFAEARKREPLFRPGPSSVLYRVASAKAAVEIPDVLEDEGYIARQPRFVSAVELGGFRSILGVPMLKDGSLVGIIVIYRQEVGNFTDKQIELVQNFAAQAVIAIENTRLLNELRQRTDDLSESLEQQTATSEVLKVISSTPGELEPVFNAMLANATRICEAKFGTLWLREGDSFRVVALHNAPPAYEERRRNRSIPLVDFHPKSAFGLFLKTRQVTHIADVRLDQGYLDGTPTTIDVADAAGARTVLLVPMLKDNELVGSITIYRQEVRPFTDKQIELVKNFAAQAVIAIENAR